MDRKISAIKIDLKFPWCETCEKKYLEAVGNKIKCGNQDICLNFYGKFKKFAKEKKR